MFPGSMLPPGAQLAAMDHGKASYDNEEDFAQRHGRLVDLAKPGNPKRLALLGTPAIVTVIVLLLLQVL